MDKTGFFDLNLNIMKWAGLWMPDQSERLAIRRLYLIYDVIVISFTVAFCVPLELLAIRFTYHHFEDLIKNISIGGIHIFTVVKIVVWFYNRKELLRIMKVLELKAAEYKAINDFDPAALLLEEQKFKNFILQMYFFLGSCVSISAYIGAMWTLITDYEKFEQTTLSANNETVYRYTQKLPYYMQMPFVYDTSKAIFAFSLIFNCLPIHYFAWITVGIDTLFISLLSHISISLKILQGAFRTIRPRCLLNLKIETHDVLRKSGELNNAMLNDMNHCVTHLQLLFRSCEKIESIFSYLALIQVLSSQILICTGLYMVSAIPITSKAFASEVFYLAAMEMQIGLYCFFGNRVTLTGDDISLSLFEGDWLSASIPFKKSMLITMTRMRRPFYLTIGKFSPLTLATFVMIGRASYSFFAIIKNK